MLLEDVDVSRNLIESLEPLRGSPLKRFISDGGMKDFDASFFTAFPTLEEIWMPADARNAESLRALPKLQRIAINGIQKAPIPAAEFWAAYQPDWCAVGTLRHQLKEAGVVFGGKNQSIRRTPDGTLGVHLGRSNLDRLDFFKGFRISSLDIASTKISDLAPLRGQPLVGLRMHDTRVTDLRPLLDCPTLENLTLPRKAQNIEVLKQLPKLRRLSYEWDSATGQPAQTAEEFWKEYDAKKK